MTTPLSPKVTAGAGGGGVGIALGVLVVWALTSAGVEVPDVVASAIGSVCSAALAAAGAWCRRDPMRDEHAARHAA